MPWLEYNVHLCQRPNYERIITVLIDLIEPFVRTHKKLFTHWHYLIEPDPCRPSFVEIRVRFEGSVRNLSRVRLELVSELRNYSDRTHLTMRDDETLGSHEGCHGNRNLSYQGAASEGFGRDWQSIIDILQIGSDSAIRILRVGRGLAENRSLQIYQRQVNHPYFLHLPANQLLVEP